MSSFFFKPAALGLAGKRGPVFFGDFFYQKISVAQGTIFSYWFVPDCKCAIRKPAAAVENFATFRFALNKIAAAVFLRAVDTGFPGGIIGK